MEVLQWAWQEGCPWNEEVSANASKNGHLNILQWVSAKGCPLSDMICLNAASGGHLKVLQWAREQGVLVERERVLECSFEWTSARSAVGAKEQLSVDRIRLYCGLSRRVSAHSKVGQGEWLSVGARHGAL